jgi:hypothetical protein
VDRCNRAESIVGFRVQRWIVLSWSLSATVMVKTIVRSEVAI